MRRPQTRLNSNILSHRTPWRTHNHQAEREILKTDARDGCRIDVHPDREILHVRQLFRRGGFGWIRYREIPPGFYESESANQRHRLQQRGINTTRGLEFVVVGQWP